MENEWQLAPSTQDGDSPSTRRLRLKIFNCAAGQFIASARQDRKLTQVEVANAFGRPSSAVSRLEAGENGFKGGFAKRVLDFLEGKEVMVPGSDKQPLRERLAQTMRDVEQSMASASSDEELERMLMEFQRQRVRGITYAEPSAVAQQSFRALSLATTSTAPAGDDRALRASIESTRRALDPLLHRAHNLPDGDARHYLTQLRSVLAALGNVDPAAFGDLEMSISSYASEATTRRRADT